MRYEAIQNLRRLTPEQRAEKRKEYECFERFWKPHDRHIAAQYRHRIEILERIEAELANEPVVLGDKIEPVLKGKYYISISRIKIETGLDGRTIARYLRGTENWERYTTGKSSRPIWVRKAEVVA